MSASQLNTTFAGATAERQIYPLTEFCAQVGFSRSHAYKLHTRGLLRLSKVLGKTVVTRSERERFLTAIERGEVA